MNSKAIAMNTISSIFGLAFLAIGLINAFWGNDPEFGIFIILLSFIYFPPVNTVIRRWMGFSIPLIAKIVLGLFIIWASLGVGELFDKIALMRGDL